MVYNISMSLILLTNLEWILFGVVALLVGSMLSYFLTGRTIFNFIIRRNNYLEKGFERKFAKLAKRYKVNYKWWDKFPNEVFNIQSYDELDLYGRIIRQNQKTNKVAIVVHGFMSRHKDMQTYVKYFYDRGFNVLAVDNRAHGLSGGNYVGMGWIDRLDLLKWIDLVLEKFGKRTQIVLFGLSMGGATVCMASGENLPRNVKCIISDSAYDNVYNQFFYIMKKHLKFTAFSFMGTFDIYNKLFFGENIKDQDTIKQVKKSKTPILIIHGDKDNFVHVDMAYKIYDAIKPQLRDIMIVKNAWHGESQAKDTSAYNKKLDNFISKYVK